MLMSCALSGLKSKNQHVVLFYIIPCHAIGLHPMLVSYALAGLKSKNQHVVLFYIIPCHAIGLHPMLVSCALAGLMVIISIFVGR
jgi:hypothetical protein